MSLPSRPRLPASSGVGGCGGEGTPYHREQAREKGAGPGEKGADAEREEPEAPQAREIEVFRYAQRAGPVRVMVPVHSMHLLVA